MSVSGRTDTRLKKTLDKTKKKAEELVRIGSSHSERPEEKITFKPIDGEDVQNLSIRETELKKLLNERSKLSDKLEKQDSVLVKKVNPKAYPTTEVKVAKLAPNKPTKPIDYSDNLGIRFDKYGNCVPHSILGTVEEYLQEAVRNGQPIDLPYDTLDSEPSADAYLAQYDSEREKNEPAIFNINNDGGEKALNNWQKRMKERKSVQDLVSKKSNRNMSELVMNQSDVLNKRNHTANVLDRALPLVENGKGNRFGSEFWNQSLQIGDENNGIFSTLTKSQRGVLPDLEQVDKPQLTFRETHFDSRQPNLKIFPWSKSKYLEQRLKKLEPIIGELMPHEVEFDHLQVKGINPYNRKYKGGKDKTEEEQKELDRANEQDDMANYTWVNPDIENKPMGQIESTGGGFMAYEDDDVLASYEDVVDEPIFGPCLVFGGQTAHWTGSEPVNDGIVALESRLNFETKAGKRVLATFEIFNAGTCCVYYDWKKVKESNPFPFLQAYQQRFYFDTQSSCILPGDALKLHIVFKSPNGGIFTEKWELITRPMLLSGASLILTLRGVALQEDKFKKKRISLEKNLFMREAEIIAKSIVEMVLQGVRTPRRSPSPIDNKLIEDQIFTTTNKSLPYDQETVDEMKQLYDNLMAEDSEVNKDEWNLSVIHLKQRMQQLEEVDPEKCHEKLATLNTCLDKMSLKPDLPSNPLAYSLCYNLICTSFDEIFNELSLLKQAENVQLPLTAEIYPTVDELDKKFVSWKKEFEIMKQIELERKNRLEKEKGGKGEKAKKADKKEDKKKEKKGTQSPSKSRNSRESALSRADSRAQLEKTVVEEKEHEPIVLTEAQIKRKELFSTKSYYNVYQILVRMFDYVEGIFESTIEQGTISEKNLSSNKPIIPEYCDFID